MALTSREKVLTCATLPSLPGVAMRILELTRDPNVSVNKIAEAVQSDPALATKVLRTVNSSFYGLTTPCPSISRAMALLGMTTVKSIVLSFSLVDFAKKLGLDGKLDMTVYWRRALFSAGGARAFAQRTRTCDPEEAFVGALIGDIGVLASCMVLKDEYVRVLDAAGENHDELPAIERSKLGMDHAQIGAELGRRWKLPAQLIASMEFHHSADASPPDSMKMVRCVSLGGMAAAALSMSEPKQVLARLCVDAKRWFGLDSDLTRATVQQTSKDAASLSKLLELNTGDMPDADTILAEASEQMIHAQVEAQLAASKMIQDTAVLQQKTVTDALTGASNRAHFDTESARLHAEAVKHGGALTVIFTDADRFKSVNDTLGHQAGDAVLRELAERLKMVVGMAGGVFRYGGEEFVALLPGVKGEEAESFAEQLRAWVENTPFNLRARGVDADDRRITVSVGVAWTSLDPAATPIENLVHAADEAVYAAKKAGRNRVFAVRSLGSVPVLVSEGPSVDAPPASVSPPVQEVAPASRSHATAAAPTSELPASPTPFVDAKQTSGVLARTIPAPGPVSVLIIEDDPFATRLLTLVFSRRSDVKATFATTAEDAMTLIGTSGPKQVRPKLILCDNMLPGMSGMQFIAAARQDRRLKHVPIVLMTATVDAALLDEAMKIGASSALSKSDFCLRFDEWMEKLIAMANEYAAAA
jgi:two-component system, cell cycle response regulator